MKASGRAVDSIVMPEESSSTTAVLSDCEKAQLNEAYKKDVPRYKVLCDDYERAKVKATNARRKSLFPSQEEWQSPCGLSENDWEMLQGPDCQIVDRTRIVVEHALTGREIVFVAAPRKSSLSRHLRSWVQLLASCGNPSAQPVIGQIQKIFSHTFGQKDMVVAHV